MREFTDGSTAMVRGALDAGCDFFAGYPITPASQILMMLMHELPKTGGFAVQAEDEIASIGMCIGAAMAGSRTMTATSVPGISLYSENIGLAIMGEIPLVIVDVQRMGPGTGAATTVGQGDVQFVRWGNGGGYPIIALAPSDLPDCYALTRKAFELAERFRCPVFILGDKELNLTSATVSSAAFEEAMEHARLGQFAPASEGEGPGPLYRFEPAEAVAPLPSYGEEILRFTGSTHDENGYIIKDPIAVEKLNRHLVEKIEAHREEIELVRADLEEGARTLVISYGITSGAVGEGVAEARNQGHKVSSLVVQSLWPIPEKAIGDALEGVDRVVVAELNLGQYRREVERLTTSQEVVGLHRIDGGLISPRQVLEAVS